LRYSPAVTWILGGKRFRYQTDGKVQRQVCKKHRKGIRHVKMRLLDLHDRCRRESGTQHANLLIEQALAHQVNQEDCQQITGRRQAAAKQVDILPSGILKDRIGQNTRGKNGQRPIHIKGMPGIMRIHRGGFGIKEIAQAVDLPKISRNPHKKTFIRMQILAFTPIDAGKTEINPDHQNQKKQHIPKSTFMLVLGWGEGGFRRNCAFGHIKITPDQPEKVQFRITGSNKS
jgi:hypothetical protein